MSAVPVALDISRLLSRAGEAVPTGIDRVELAYAEYLAERPERAEFVALHPLGRFGTLRFDTASRFIQSLARRWNGAPDEAPATALRRTLHRQLLLAPERSAPEAASAYLLLSHHHLTRPQVIAATLARRRCAFIPMVHDLIPSDFPEYARPNEAQKHLRRMDTVARLADGVMVPSEAVRRSLLPYLAAAGRAHVPVRVVRHGVHLTDFIRGAQEAPEPGAPPYFVCLGTIEPRKNHILLLNIWRRLVERQGDHAPRLILIGRRGWENENVVDMIERCPGLQGIVEEHSALPDDAVARLLQGARALLFPSFAEGFGLPLAEAAALGVPVVCSDIPVFREVGGDAPEYLDPLDGLGWLASIERRAAARAQRHISGANALSWRESVKDGMAFAEGVAAGLVRSSGAPAGRMSENFAEAGAEG